VEKFGAAREKFEEVNLEEALELQGKDGEN
jgi:hypothetical protein